MTDKGANAARVEQVVMSDGSIAWNVQVLVADSPDDIVVAIGCVSQDQAEGLAQLLNDVAWIQAA